MKKTFVAAAFLAFALTSCGGETTTEDNVENAQEKADRMTDELMDDMEASADTLKANMDEGVENMEE